jgi:hypothetical protein
MKTSIGDAMNREARVPVHRRALKGGARHGLLALCCVGILACREGPEPAVAGTATATYSGDQEAAIAPYGVMAEKDMVPLRLDRVGQISLGRSAAESPASVERVKIGETMIMVVDEAGRRIRTFGRDGRLVANLAIDSTPKRDHRSPVALAARGDSMFVLDLDQSRGVTAYDGQGHRLFQFPIRLNVSTVDYAVDGQSSVVASMGKDDDILNRRRGLLWTVERDGGSRLIGCVPDPLYRTSLQGDQLFQLFRFFGVAIGYGKVYCRQPVSPVVQMLGLDGRSLGVLRRAPPFYMRPPDISQRNANKPTMDAFRAKWTEHAYFFPRSKGFLSSYTTFDLKNGRDRHLLFACDSATGPTRCGTSELAGRPADFIAPDTLVVVEPIEHADDLQRLGFYVLRP